MPPLVYAPNVMEFDLWIPGHVLHVMIITLVPYWSVGYTRQSPLRNGVDVISSRSQEHCSYEARPAD